MSSDDICGHLGIPARSGNVLADRLEDTFYLPLDGQEHFRFMGAQILVSPNDVMQRIDSIFSLELDQAVAAMGVRNHVIWSPRSRLPGEAAAVPLQSPRAKCFD